jgi:FixJ family two-component response regulator
VKVTEGLICVVDDDQSMGRMLDRGLRAAGFDVALFRSAEAFLESGRLADAFCLILDVHLPGMTGVELQQQLNQSEMDVPVILISGQSDEQIVKRALSAGALGFFNKPFSLSRILAAIETIEPKVIADCRLPIAD